MPDPIEAAAAEIVRCWQELETVAERTATVMQDAEAGDFELRQEVAEIIRRHLEQPQAQVRRAFAEVQEQALRVLADRDALRAAAEAGYLLSTWAAAIVWSKGQNTQVWLDGLRERIEKCQALCKAVGIDGKGPTT